MGEALRAFIRSNPAAAKMALEGRETRRDATGPSALFFAIPE